MDMLIEALIELIFDTSLELAKNKKISKWIRYPLIILIILFIVGIIGCLMSVGVVMILSKERPQMIIGELIILLAIIFSTIILRNIKKEKDKRIRKVK